MEATIDLGYADPDEEVVAPRRGLRPEQRQRRMSAVAAAVVVAVVIGLSGPATPPEPVIPKIGAIELPPGGAFQLEPDGAYVYTQTNGGNSQIERYDLGGTAQWHVPLPSTADAVTITESGPTTYVQFGFAATADVGYVWALDRRTGRRMWQVANAEVITVHGDRALVSNLVDDGVHLTDRNATTGAVIWQHVLDVEGDLTPPTADGRQIFAIDPAGQVRAFDLDDTGAEHDATLRSVAGLGGVSSHSLVTIGDTLMLTGPTSGGEIFGYRISAITGADGGSVGPAWTDTVRSDPSFNNTSGSDLSLAACGVVLCAFVGAEAYGIDPQVGRSVWKKPSSVVSPLGSWLVVTPFDFLGSGQSTVVDPRTGTTLLKLGPWSPATQPDDSAVFIAPTSAVAGGSPAAAYNSSNGESAYVAELTGSGSPTDPVRLRTVGSVTLPGFDCRYEADHLACLGAVGGQVPETVGGLVGLWRVHN